MERDITAPRIGDWRMRKLRGCELYRVERFQGRFKGWFPRWTMMPGGSDISNLQWATETLIYARERETERRLKEANQWEELSI